MSQLDLTVVVTAHAEGRLLRPTLRSIRVAIDAAVAAGFAAELLLVCDRADTATLSEALAWRAREDLPFSIRVIEVSVGESGAARNAGAEEALGEFVAFIDGDDLVSSIYLHDGLTMLRASGEPLIAHPEYIVSFGARSLVWRADSALSSAVSYRDLIRYNLWPSSAIARRSVFLDNPYRSLHPGSGYGPEDWVWNIDTTVAGIAHVVVPDSVFFYRVRERGGVNNRHSTSILPWFDLEALKQALPLRPGSAEAATMRVRARRLAHTTYDRAVPAVRVATAWLSFEAKRAIYLSARWTFRVLSGQGVGGARTSIPPRVAQALMESSELEPAISWTAFNFGRLPIWHARDDGYAEVLEAALAEIGERAHAIVAVPWVGVGGADIVSLNYAKALEQTSAFGGRTTILGTYREERTIRAAIPTSLNYVHLSTRWLSFHEDLKRRLIAQIVIMARPSLIVSVNCLHLTQAMQNHAGPILDGTRVFATLFAFDRIGEGYPVNPITDDSQRHYLDEIDALITDNTNTQALIADILALPESKVLVHRQPAMERTPTLALATRAHTDEHFSEQHPFRLLWPHRLDDEKRPDSLPAISRELQRRGVPVIIDVWGAPVMDSHGESLMKDLAAAGVVYRGPYSGGLGALATHEYHALLLTSKSEGLPLVLVQSLLHGLPVIASRVGGVPDIIIDGETGLLTAGPDDIAGFAEAVELLMRDLELRRRLIERGYQFALEKHSWESFTAAVDSAFG